jgi:hypothetical protein
MNNFFFINYTSLFWEHALTMVRRGQLKKRLKINGINKIFISIE